MIRVGQDEFALEPLLDLSVRLASDASLELIFSLLLALLEPDLKVASLTRVVVALHPHTATILLHALQLLVEVGNVINRRVVRLVE